MLVYCCLRLRCVWTEICSCVGVVLVVELPGSICSCSCSEGVPTAEPLRITQIHLEDVKEKASPFIVAPIQNTPKHLGPGIAALLCLTHWRHDIEQPTVASFTEQLQAQKEINSNAEGISRIIHRVVFFFFFFLYDRTATRLILSVARWPRAVLYPPPSKATPTLVCNLLFIARRQGNRDWERQITWSRFSPTTTTIIATSPILSRGHCVGKQMEWLPFVVQESSVCTAWWGCWMNFVFRAEFECSLTIQSTQANDCRRSHCANNDAWEGSN